MSAGTRTARAAERIEKQEAAAKLGGWEQLVRDVTLPMDIHAAVFTGRRELLKTAIRPMDVNEVRQVLELVGVLLDTNRALQAHSSMVAERVEQLLKGLKGHMNAMDQLDDFANFRAPSKGDDDDA